MIQYNIFYRIILSFAYLTLIQLFHIPKFSSKYIQNYYYLLKINGSISNIKTKTFIFFIYSKYIENGDGYNLLDSCK